MKICITGKGGSGKSVITTLLARAISGKGRSVLVIDADESNLGLVRMLGVGKQPKTLMASMGGKPGVRTRLNQSVKNTGSGDKHKARVFDEQEIKITDIPSETVGSESGVRLVQVGKIEHSHEGCACMMGVLGREFLDKLALAPDEVVLADMEAGVEHFGRGVENGADAVVIVVDPSFESVLMAEKISGLAREMSKPVFTILNKVPHEAEDALKNELATRGVQVKATVHQDPEIFSACMSGKQIKSENAEQELAPLVQALLQD